MWLWRWLCWEGREEALGRWSAWFCVCGVDGVGGGGSVGDEWCSVYNDDLRRRSWLISTRELEERAVGVNMEDSSYVEARLQTA